jgi:hypothetical protein
LPVGHWIQILDEKFGEMDEQTRMAVQVEE